MLILSLGNVCCIDLCVEKFFACHIGECGTCLSFSYVPLFFFQAEDGIRDYKVTGVQTCALPISADGLLAGIGRVNGDRFDDERARCAVLAYDYTVLAGTQGLQNHRKKDRLFELAAQIGRASCRERGESGGGGVTVKRERKWRRGQ